jgi:hypothetical protein
VVDEEPRERQPQAAGGAEDRGDCADRGPAALAGKLVVDDCEAEREDRAPRALQDPEPDQRPDAPGSGGADAAGQEDREADRQRPALSVLVAELPISGVSTAELSRKPVKIQAAQVGVVCRSCRSDVRAGSTIVC